MAETTASAGATGSDPGQGRGGVARRGRIVTAISLAAVVGVAIWMVHDASRPATTRKPAVRLLTLERPFPAEGRFPSDPYVGPQTCAECHPGEYAHYLGSGHARTLRAAGRRSLARRLDGIKAADPEHPEVQWDYRYRDEQLHIVRTADRGVEDSIAEYAFGSGHHATTFLSVIDPGYPTILEHRLTYYTKEHALGLTPGHSARSRLPGVTERGGVIVAGDAKKCFGCHTTQNSGRSDKAIDAETMIPNVSCERCHGPGRAHVEAARRDAPESELELPFGAGRYTAEGLLTLCGTCHRHPSRSRPGQIRPENPQMARFQPVGLLQSRCFRESGGAFSCVTCHDPHARASTDRAAYLAVCLSCHSGDARGAAPGPPDGPARAAVPGRPCPVEPRGDCVACHMPRVDAGQHVLFADHWIRVRRPGDTDSAPRGPAPNLRLLDTPDP